MRTAVKDLVSQAEWLFEKRRPMLGLWQTIADNFYPERADFITSRNVGVEFADHLYSSYPIMARRDLGNSIASMLRKDKWFKIRTDQDDDETKSLQWLDRATDVQYKLMHGRSTGFVRATNEGDHDFAAFGQAAISVELNPDRNGLLYRCWHLRDVAWTEDHAGNAESVFRKWNPTAGTLKKLFKNTSDKLDQIIRKNRNQEVNCMHIVVPREHYNGDEEGLDNYQYVSIYVDIDNDHEMEIVGVNHMIYVVPRWQTVSGSQYAYSPAAVAALPDGRLLQAMTQTLLEAGERFTTPPMIGVQEALRSDIQLFAGGITWVDAEYDERLGEVLRPITQDKSGMPLGLEMQADTRAMIAEAFYLNKLSLPPAGVDMTAYEVSERIKEFVRQTLPLFGPLETEYNGQLCEATFDILMSAGAFGSPYDIPEELQGSNVQFQFTSPIQDANDRDNGQKFLEMKNLLREAAEADQMAVANVDINEAFRDALRGVGVPSDWIVDEKMVEQIKQQKAMEQAAMMAMQQ